MTHSDVPGRFANAAAAFRKFFLELREAFFERDALFTQIELALLCREHVLVVGPPGTAKSAIASAVLGRIVDEKTGLPSLFAKQISESTVQTDLIGPVDFKVLQETGRTEYITDEGMLGATHAFLDEVFDGRDMLLRSILNVLHERELKHGRKVTPGKFECAIMTSNRYLSEVLARSSELLLAFADRLSFICFCPKSFAHPTSRAAMLQRAVKGQRMDLRASLTLQQLDVLQEAVDRVVVGSAVTEGLELLADALERTLLAQVAKLPDYVPTKYFSQRSLVKALWALKAAVVRDKIHRHPDRPLEATSDDLEALRHFFLLGGPPPDETELLLKAAVDPRERAQLEIIRLEHRAFAEALEKARAGMEGGVDREARELAIHEEHAAAESLMRAWQPAMAMAAISSLKRKLVPGPRHGENRAALVAAGRMLVASLEQKLSRGLAGQDGRGGVALFESFRAVLQLCEAVPELHDRQQPLAGALSELCEQALEMIALSAEGTAFDEAMKLEALAGLAQNLEEELAHIAELADALAASSPDAAERLRHRSEQTRRRVAVSIRSRAMAVFQAGRPRKGDPLESLSSDARKLAQLEAALVSLSPDQGGLRQELLGPMAAAYAREVFSGAVFSRIDQLARLVQSVAENLRKEGVSPAPILLESREVIERRLREHVKSLTQPIRLPEVPHAMNGEAYLHYRQQLLAGSPDGELTALMALESALKSLLSNGAQSFVSREILEDIAQIELSHTQARVKYLRSWLSQLLSTLPAPEELKQRPDAERAFDRLVKSRFPLLATKEGELVRLQGTLALLSQQGGAIGEQASKLGQMLQGIAEDFASFSKRLLDVRASL